MDRRHHRIGSQAKTKYAVAGAAAFILCLSLFSVGFKSQKSASEDSSWAFFSDSKENVVPQVLKNMVKYQKLRIPCNSNPDFVQLNLVEVKAGKPHYMACPALHRSYFAWDICKVLIAGQPFDLLQTLYAEAILSDCNSKPGGLLMLDVGAHLGYFTYIAASLGCRVAAIEPVREHVQYHKMTQVFNNIPEGQVVIHNNICSDQEASVDFDGWNVGVKKAGEDENLRWAVEPIRIDQIADESVRLLKIDIEGYEALGLRSAKRLLEHHTIDFILIEVTYHLIGSRIEGIREELEMLMKKHHYRFILLEEGQSPMEILAKDFDLWWSHIDKEEVCPQTSLYCQTNALLAHPKASVPEISGHPMKVWDRKGPATSMRFPPGVASYKKDVVAQTKGQVAPRKTAAVPSCENKEDVLKLFFGGLP